MRKTYIEVREGSRTFHRQGTSKKGKEFNFYQQEVLVHNRRGEVSLMMVNIEDESKAYAPGRYTVDDDCIGIIKNQRGYDTVGLTSIQLVPLPASALKAAA